jgi:hypothetical protein
MFAAEGFDLSHVCVNVKNSQAAYAGRAYARVPNISNAPKSAKRLVVVRIGKPESFPKSNRYTHYKWVRVEPGESLDSLETRTTKSGEVQKRISFEQNYGGEKSPFIEYRCWREALLAVAAHEFKHIEQFQNKSTIYEWACEKAAAKRLDAWREQDQKLSILEDPPVPPNPVISKLKHARKMLAKNQSKMKRAATSVQSWQKKIKSYEKKLASC